jgi:type IV pilus assembly protein PilM
MNILSGVNDFFGLDIGTTAIRLVQLSGKTSVKNLVKYAYIPIDSKIALSDSPADRQKLSAAISELITHAQMTTKNVAVGLPSSKVFTTVFDIERLSRSELARAIQYQADSLIPTALSESKIDWAMIGDYPSDKTKVEVLLSSVTNEFVEQRLDMIEAIGLNVIAFEPETIALTRALVSIDNTLAQMVVDIGNKSTDLIINMNGTPRLTRSIPTGTDAIVKSAIQNLNIVDAKQAEQLVFKFGLVKEKLEGQVYEAIIGTIDLLLAEIEKSIKFFQTRYAAEKLDRILVTGGASSLPAFPLYVANKFGLDVEIGNAWHNVSYDPSRQSELLDVSNHFAVAAGLAERHV